MARKNLYEIINNYALDSTTAFSRIRYYFDEARYYTDQNEYFDINLREYIEKYIFDRLPIRKAGQIDLSDLLHDIGLNSLSGQKSFDDLFIFIELLACCEDNMPSSGFLYYGVGKQMFNAIFKCINEVLSSINYRLVESKDGRIIIQNDPIMEEAINATEDEDLAILLYKYRRYGNAIEDKKQILLAILNVLAPEIQERRKSTKTNRYKETAIKIDNISNNFNIRHNNKNGKDKKEYAANLSDQEQEYWLDSLYETILVFILEKNYRKSSELLEKIQKPKK